jgi:hypothetical protein
MPDPSVCFLHVGADLAIPSLMVASVRAAMPGAEIVQMTDAATAAVPGVDGVIRHDWDGKKLMIFRLAHLAAFERPACVILDTDVVVQHSLAPVFGQAFDVALTVRHEPVRNLDKTRDLAPEMPYNTGVMFSREPAFWRAAVEHCRALPEKNHDWWGDQLSVKHVADTGRFRVIELPCDVYNYSPRTEDEDVRDRHAVHYKGARKVWMKQRFDPYGAARRKRGLLARVLLDIFRPR